jgi:hypothetical protein
MTTHDAHRIFGTTFAELSLDLMALLDGHGAETQTFADSAVLLSDIYRAFLDRLAPFVEAERAALEMLKAGARDQAKPAV